MKSSHTRTKQQKIEQYYFDMFRKAYPLPSGVICHDDKPDVIVNGPQTLGIEITNFFVADGVSPNSEQVQRKRRQAAVTKAQQLYQQATGNNIDLTFGFDKKHPIQDVIALATQLALLAGRVENRDNGTIG
jgi:hypothetical protein